MKIFFSLLPLLVSISARAQAPEVKITSFNSTGSHGTSAELCGKVVGSSGNEVVQINADPDSKVPGHYTSLVADDGSFCVVIATLTGKATAGIRGASHLEVTTLQPGLRE